MDEKKSIVSLISLFGTRIYSVRMNALLSLYSPSSYECPNVKI